ncbi:MAG TPA: DUF2092 domain-containing protein [Polyangia bacterium]
MSKRIWMLAALLMAVPAAAREPVQRPSIDPKAEQVLRRMSGYLASLESFRVETEIVDELVLKNGQKLQEVSESRVAVKRPNRLRSDRLGPVADVTFRYDGNEFSIYGKRTGMYATAAAPPDIDRAIDVARDKLGIYAPGGDLLYSDPYAVLTEDAFEGTYVGLEPLAGVNCHHLAFRGKDVDWQIWVQDGPQPLPRRYQITSKNDPGQPEFAVDLSHWDPQANVSDQEFTFAPPAGATRIPFLTRGNTASR